MNTGANKVGAHAPQRINALRTVRGYTQFGRRRSNGSGLPAGGLQVSSSIKAEARTWPFQDRRSLSLDFGNAKLPSFALYCRDNGCYRRGASPSLAPQLLRRPLRPQRRCGCRHRSRPTYQSRRNLYHLARTRRGKPDFPAARGFCIKEIINWTTTTTTTTCHPRLFYVRVSHP